MNNRNQAFFVLIVATGALILLLALGGNFMIRTLGEWATSNSVVAIEKEHTEQARIEWGARVQIAEIQADVTKKTSLEFWAGWVVRAATWGIGFVLVGGAFLGVLLLFGRGGNCERYY